MTDTPADAVARVLAGKIDEAVRSLHYDLTGDQSRPMREVDLLRLQELLRDLAAALAAREQEVDMLRAQLAAAQAETRQAHGVAQALELAIRKARRGVNGTETFNDQFANLIEQVEILRGRVSGVDDVLRLFDPAPLVAVAEPQIVPDGAHRSGLMKDFGGRYNTPEVPRG